MCWSVPYTIIFSILYICFGCYFLMTKPTCWKSYIAFSAFYFTMEIFQLSQWLYGDVIDDHNTHGNVSCSLTNEIYTYVAYILIWLQPILFCYIGLRDSIKYKNFFEKYMWFVSGVFCIAMLTLIMGSLKGDPGAYIIKDSIYGTHTCTSIGPTHHLGWQFKPIIIDYQPNHFAYLALCILSFMFYDRKELKCIVYGWFLALILTIKILKPSNTELASSWCLLSIIGELTIFFSVIFS